MWCRWAVLPLLWFGLSGAVAAQQTAIFAGTETVTFSINGTEHQIDRNGPACPPNCLTAQAPAQGVQPMAELELIAFLQGPVSAGVGLVIDTRLPDDFTTGNIPGAINIPHPTLAADNPFRAEIFKALGVTTNGTDPNFTGAKILVLYCDGPTCTHAADAIRDLVRAGYPTDRLFYYRGGVQFWSQLGLTLERTGS